MSARRPLQFGVFDQNDRGNLPISVQYENRLKLAELYDASGFHCFHMSEHHSTSLSTTPSPSVYMSALTQRTRRLRLCPLVYLLPLYHPVRLAEEICMLDHLSGGRFEFGVGRGASPHELAALGVDPTRTAEMFSESLAILDHVFSSHTVTFSGQFWTVDDYVVELKPLQLPRPPMWYAVGSPNSAQWPASKRLNIVCGGPVARVGAITDRYREEWAKLHRTEQEPLIGVNRYIIVAANDEEARQIGRRAWPTFFDNFIKLWRRHGTEPTNIKLPSDFDELMASGHAVAGSAGTVTDLLASQIVDGGLNYLIGSFMFGNMPQRHVLDSVGLFAEEVMPTLRRFETVPV